VLGVERGASPATIRRAYLARSLECHPDRNGEDPEATSRFQELSNAFQTLTAEVEEADDPPDDDVSSANVSRENDGFFGASFFGGRDPFSRGHTERGGWVSENSRDVFEEVFGGGGPADPFGGFFQQRQPVRQAPPRDVDFSFQPRRFRESFDSAPRGGGFGVVDLSGLSSTAPRPRSSKTSIRFTDDGKKVTTRTVTVIDVDTGEESVQVTTTEEVQEVN
jgi:curved DNA-binding protein CbpA